MSTSLPSLMTRKKRIPGYSGLNSEKVLADYAPNEKCPKSFYQETFQGSNNDNAQRAAGKISTENPNQVSFIYQNPRFINEPICFANTKITNREQNRWWPDIIPSDSKPKTTFTTGTINRTDYKKVKEEDRPKGLTRFGFNKGKSNFAKGIIPDLNQESALIAKEKISYEHQFDSRKERTERGRLHGSFVWETVTDPALLQRIKNRLTENQTCIY